MNTCYRCGTKKYCFQFIAVGFNRRTTTSRLYGFSQNQPAR